MVPIALGYAGTIVGASNARLSVPCELLHELLSRKEDSALDRADP